MESGYRNNTGALTAVATASAPREASSRRGSDLRIKFQAL